MARDDAGVPLLFLGSVERPSQGWLAIEVDVAARAQLPERFASAVVPAVAWCRVPPTERRLLIHNLAAHLLPGARVLVGRSVADEVGGHARACGLDIADLDHVRRDYDSGMRVWAVYRRTERVTIHDLVAEARAGLVRLSPTALAARLGSASDCLVLDTRTPADRRRFGAIAGSRSVPRTVLEWRCDPASGYAEVGIEGFDQLLVVVCNEGYSSSLSAMNLQRLGFVNATDLIGGVMAWRAAGLPLVIDEPVDDDLITTIGGCTAVADGCAR